MYDLTCFDKIRLYTYTYKYLKYFLIRIKKAGSENNKLGLNYHTFNYILLIHA